MSYNLIVLSIICILAVLTGFIRGLILEKRNYNNGVCPHCGTKLTNFDMGSSGARGYTCKKCNYTTWVSSNRVDKNYKNK